MTKNGRTPSAKREDAISNSEVHLSKIGPARCEKNYKGHSRRFDPEATRPSRGRRPKSANVDQMVRDSVHSVTDTRNTLPRELDTTDTHNRRPKCQEGRKGHARRENIPSRGQKERLTRTSFPGSPRQMSPFSGHAILCKQGRWGRGALPPLLCTGGDCL